ncbi:serine hydrolase domain-containing protein [Deinococcus roseus]|uniref:Beta-lactamase-related domain-containing protein n=1 Tax=Deinococcus roseus TaxID=392414 RepID=A0ABQ2CZN9_9DEIO|nr:serine hydrolase domain-containing protein [Deinococcus roseus]GGJ36790.1 hypothetical protein GCM10008938_23590 [Deinococcus roseus]
MKSVFFLPLTVALFGPVVHAQFANPWNTQMSRLVTQHNLPSLSVVLFDDQKVLGQGVGGVRKIGTPEKVTVTDVHHLGSISKSFTATLLGVLVEQKKLGFQSTLKELFPKLTIHPDLQNITLDQLLSHRSGLMANLPDNMDWWDNTIPLQERRDDVLKTVLGTPPFRKPGTVFLYSNVGYALAAMAAEKATGQTYSQLLQQHIFGPLHMNSCSVGFTWDTRTVSQPWPHKMDGGKAVAVLPVFPTAANGKVLAGNTEAINGADNVRCSLPDLAKYLQAHMNGQNGQDSILKASTFQELHKDHHGDKYAYGWNVYKDQRGTFFTHDGSNTLNYASMWILPEKRLGVVVTSNIGEVAAEAVHQGVNLAFDALLK